MVYISDETIDRFIKEDIPYIDLTTMILGIGAQTGRITFSSREDAILSGTEEVIRIFKKFNVTPIKSTASGVAIKKGEMFLIGEGSAENLHMVWKVSLNILEYCCGIATRTMAIVNKAKKINPYISIVTTRKSFPGTKELTIKSILAGGAYPHRLGLSETILIFKHHVNFLGGFDNLAKMIKDIKINACEKKVIVEVENLDNAIILANAGVDGLQFDKIEPDDLKVFVNKIRTIAPNITIIAAGGVNVSNIEDYAASGVNAVATTSIYFGKPVDISAKIDMI